MINVLFVVVVLALIVAAAFAFAYKVRGEEWEEKYWAENRLHLDTTIQLSKSQEELNKANSRIQQLEESLRNKEQKPEEVGTFVQHRALRPATPETYRVVFDLDLNGQRILEHLTQKYCRNAFSNTDRETNYKLGQQSVVAGIINEINKANDPNYSEVENDA
ncbi:Bbp19 family protein [Acinetobacter baumannii]